MKISFIRLMLFNLILLGLIFPNFINLLISNNQNQNKPIQVAVEQNPLAFPSTIGISKVESQNLISQKSQSINYSLGIPIERNFRLTNQNMSYLIHLNQTFNGQIIYFEINQSVKINLLDSNTFIPNTIFTFFQSNFAINKFFGMIRCINSNDLEFNISSASDIINSPIFVSVSLFFPKNGYNFDSAINVLTNETQIGYNAVFPFENLYFKLSLDYNRRVDFSIKEGLALNGSSMDKSDIKFYQWDTTNSIQTLINDYPTPSGPGIFSYSWVSSGNDPLSDSIWIEVNLTSGFVGNFSLDFSYQLSGYSINSAIPLTFNQELILNQSYRDRYVQNTFFKFKIDQTDINITIYAHSTDPLVIANSKFRIYFERIENLVNEINEVSSGSVGQVNTSFVPLKAGTYYIEYLPVFYAPTGLWQLKVSYIVLPTFIWSFPYILLNILYFIAIPILLTYLKIKNSHEEIKEWEINQNNIEFFKILSKNPRLNPKMEVPFQKILLQRRNIFIRDIILDVVPVHTDTESEDHNSLNQTSLGFRYKKTLDQFTTIALVLMLAIYWLINVIFYEFYKTTFLPLRITDLNSINEVIFYLIIPLIVILLIINFYTESYVKAILNEIEYSINELNPDKYNNVVKIDSLDNENLLKNLAYVRVLWNQAVKAFNEKNYSLFVIRADNCIKKLIETRFQQLIGPIDEKLEFNGLIEAVRNQGFDVPSSKKIEYFRKIRNKVVHSSHLLDEKSAIETFTYYSKFLNRLGLRT